LLTVFDVDRDGGVSAAEIARATATLSEFDDNEDGQLTDNELPSFSRGNGWPWPWGFQPADGSLFEEEVPRPPVSAGYVFLNGEYVPPPYTVQQVEGQASINGRTINTTSPNPSFLSWQWQQTPGRMFRTALESNEVVIACADQPTLVLGGSTQGGLEFLRLLLLQNRSPAAVQEFLKFAPEAQHLAEWLTTFEPAPELLQRMQADVDRVSRDAGASTQFVAAQRWSKTWSYPITVFGMFTVALAAGHMLSFRWGAETSPRAERSVVLSVLLIVTLSALDLLWTLIAWKTSSMRELNPLGSRLISDPGTLVAFKALATGLAAAILVGLRHRRLAQLSSFWLCLVCMLVACRWLVFKTMFQD
jgi:hypothetical protein